VNDWSAGSAINSIGQIAGYHRDPFTRAFLWTPTTPNSSTGTLVDLGFFVGGLTDRLAMNSLGHIVGATTTGAFLWTPDVPNDSTGAMTDLNTVLSSADNFHWTLLGARGINDFGQIVGVGQFDPDGPGALPSIRRGFLLTPVPEPGSLVLAGLALFGFAAIRRHGDPRGAAGNQKASLGVIDHNVSKLCQLAAAMVTARLAISCPRTSAKSSS
jgi:hypothetical protein